MNKLKWKRYTEDRINYSCCNEDNKAELRVLQPEGKRIIIVTASGGRVLNLLVKQPEEIWAVDMNPCQNHLLELKIAAISALGRDEFLAFMGLHDSSRRVVVYKDLEGELSIDAKTFFRENIEKIAKGILFQGELERACANKIGRALRLIKPKKLKTLFEFTDLEEQKEFVRKEIDTFVWRSVLLGLAREPFISLFADGFSAGFGSYLPKGFPINRAIYNSIGRYMYNNLARDNYLLSVMFFGRYLDNVHLPIHMLEENYDTIKQMLDQCRIRIITSPIIDVLAECEDDYFDGYALSDIASFLSDSEFDRLIEQIIRTSRPGGRICSRQCFYHRDISQTYQKHILRDNALEQELALREYTMFHEFLAGEIVQ